MNPARSLGPAIALWQFSHLWLYVAGPLAGAAIAVGFAFLLRGPPDPGGKEAASGNLDATRHSAVGVSSPT